MYIINISLCYVYTYKYIHMCIYIHICMYVYVCIELMFILFFTLFIISQAPMRHLF